MTSKYGYVIDTQNTRVLTIEEYESIQKRVCQRVLVPGRPHRAERYICSVCNHVIMNGHRYCGFCGAKIVGTLNIM